VIRCRATINLVGATAGTHVLADPADPAVAVYLEKGYLVPDEDSGLEGVGAADGQGDPDDRLDTDAAVGDGTEVAL
jgi:hypothetical protein